MLTGMSQKQHILFMNEACNLQELQNDPLGILRPASKLQHNLQLASAYAAVYDARDTSAAQQKQKRRMDTKYHEPKVDAICRQHGSFADVKLFIHLELGMFIHSCFMLGTLLSLQQHQLSLCCFLQFVV